MDNILCEQSQSQPFCAILGSTTYHIGGEIGNKLYLFYSYVFTGGRFNQLVVVLKCCGDSGNDHNVVILTEK